MLVCDSTVVNKENINYVSMKRKTFLHEITCVFYHFRYTRNEIN